MAQKLRSEISDEYKWNLKTIYSDIQGFKKDLKEVESLIEQLPIYKDDLTKTSENLYNCLDLEFKISRILDKMYMYAHLNLDGDTTDSKNQELVGIVKNLFQKFEEEISFIKPNLLKMDYKDIENYYKEYPKLKEYEVVLKDIFRYKNHVLNENEELIVSNLSKALSSSSNTYEMLTDSDMSFGIIKDENNNEVELTSSNYSKYIKSKDRNVRKTTFNQTLNTYSNFKNTISSTYVGDIEVNSAISKIYKFNSAIEASLYDDNINVEVYDNLIKTVSDNLDVLFKYYELKKECLNLDEFHLYDTYVSIVDSKEKEYSFDEAKKLVFNALNVLGDKYINDLNKAFDEKWIDIYNNKGKRSGAYSSGSYDTNPYVLLNYEGTLNHVSTLAHELGHSMHSYYSRKNNSFQNSNYKIFVAEVASTVNELLLDFYILNNTNDNNEKLIIINEMLDLFKATIYRQTMFAEFEEKMYYKHENNEILTYEVLCDEYYKLNKKYFGENVVVDDGIRYEWERIPHFYYNFYVYKYATGLSAACYIVENILNDKNNMKEKYLNFLSLGGSMEPLDELKTMGIDMTKKDVIESAINMFDNLIDQFKSIKK